MLAELYLKDVEQRFRGLKRLGDGAITQISDEELFRTLGPESNSIAIIMKHVAGNMRSRWTDLLTTDGEKPDRNRDREFVLEDEDRKSLMKAWEVAWACLFKTLTSLAPEDLTRTVLIRHQPHTVVAAINRQLEHYGYHVGQMVLLAKHFKSSAWQCLSIPRGKSDTFNERMRVKHGGEA